MIKRFERFGHKPIAVYHGLGGRPAKDRIDLLSSMGYEVIYPFINFEKEWDIDKGKSLFQRELNNIKDVDILIGFSLGGYLAYLLAKTTGKDLVLVNPALDRSKSTLGIKEFGIQVIGGSLGRVEAFFGENDKVVLMDDQVDFLKTNNVKFDQYIIKDMEHRTPIDKFEEIINRSKIL